MRLLALLLLPLVLSSCMLTRSDSNEPISAEKIARLVPGQTTAKEVVELLGAPNDVVQLGKRSAYVYEHARSKNAGLFLIVVLMLNTDARSDRLWVFFDENDRLTHYGATLAADRTEWAMPWFNLYEEEEPEQK